MTLSQRCYFRSSATAMMLLALASCAAPEQGSGFAFSSAADAEQAVISTRTVPVIERDGLRFRDSDRDGALTPYEDWRLSPRQRASDLVGRMTLAEKAGMMVVGTLVSVAAQAGSADTPDSYDAEVTARLMEGAHVTHFISRLSTRTRALAAANNTVQDAAERTRLAIPAVIMTDPRHGFTELVGASVAGGQFSQWPNGVGIAALDDTEFVEDYAALVRDDLRAAGFGLLLGPQIDLASEPRWPRNFDTFGEDAEVSARVSAAFVRGLQGGPDGLVPGGVASVIKHFAGYSASATGYDAHNYYGRYSQLNEAEWEQHLRPFIGALQARPAGVMPSYSILQMELDGQPLEQVGAGYNRRLLSGVLRGELGFEGVIVSDWAITRDCNEKCRNGSPAGEPPSFADLSTGWGVQDLSVVERFAMALNAGMDQFGGVDDPSPIVAAVEAGLVDAALIDASAQRILEQSFSLGLFENPFVDPGEAERTIGTTEEIARGIEAQSASMVILKNPQGAKLNLHDRVILFGVDDEAAIAAGFIPVVDPDEADFAILRTRSPSQLLHPGYVFGAMHQEGSLAFRADHPALAFMNSLPADLNLLVDVQLDRPAILTPFTMRANALVASFGASDAALLNALRGRPVPRGRLPFELPSSMQAVESQRPGAPADSTEPLFPLGFSFTD